MLTEQLMVVMIDYSSFFFTLLRVAGVFNREEVNPLRRDAVDRGLELKSPFRVAGMSVQPAIVEGIGDKPADRRIKTVRAIQENAAFRAYRGLVAQQEVQDRQACVSRMHTLHGLTELHLVADQHDVAGGSSHC